MTQDDRRKRAQELIDALNELAGPKRVLHGALQAWIYGLANNEPPAPVPWSPARMERVGRAAWEAKMKRLPGFLVECADASWAAEPAWSKEEWFAIGEAAVRADEETG